MPIRIENQWSVSRQISSPCTYPCMKHSIVVFTLSISIAIPELSTAPMITIITSRGTPQSRPMPTRIEPRIRTPDKCPINALLTRPTKPYSTGSPRSLISQTGDSPYFSRLVFATMYVCVCRVAVFRAGKANSCPVPSPTNFRSGMLAIMDAIRSAKSASTYR